MAVELPGQILSQKDVRETVTNTEETSPRYNLNFAKYKGSSPHLGTISSMAMLSPDGRNVYATNTGNTIGRWTIPVETPWSIISLTNVSNFDVTSKDIEPEGMWLSPDGTKMYFVGSQNDKIYAYNLSTPWDTNTSTFWNDFDISAKLTHPTGISFRRDGELCFISGKDNDKIVTYFLSTPWNIATATFLDELAYINPLDNVFSENGKYLFILTTTTLFRYICSTRFRVSSATLDQTFIISPPTSTAAGVVFKSCGTRMYICTGSYIYQYELKKGWR